MAGPFTQPGGSVPPGIRPVPAANMAATVQNDAVMFFDLYEVEVYKDLWVFLTSNTEQVNYRGNAYYPGVVDIKADLDANAMWEEKTITVSFGGNAANEANPQIASLISYLRSTELRGNRVLIRKVARNQLSDPVAHALFPYLIRTLGTGDQGVEFTLAKSSDLQRLRTPNRRVTRGFCAWTFREAPCNYRGADTTCDYTFDGPNGCLKHGNQAQYGGFPTIPQVLTFRS